MLCVLLKKLYFPNWFSSLLLFFKFHKKIYKTNNYSASLSLGTSEIRRVSIYVVLTRRANDQNKRKKEKNALFGLFLFFQFSVTMHLQCDCFIQMLFFRFRLNKTKKMMSFSTRIDAIYLIFELKTQHERC